MSSEKKSMLYRDMCGEISLSFYLFIVSIRLGKLIWQTLCQLINNSICCINDLSIQRLGSSELKMGSNAGEGRGEKLSQTDHTGKTVNIQLTAQVELMPNSIPEPFGLLPSSKKKKGEESDHFWPQF